MATVIPRHVVCFLGEWRDLDAVEAIVRRVAGPGFEVDREFSQLTPDGRMLAAFEASCDRVTPSMTKEDWKAIRGHRAVVYVLSPPIRKPLAADISGRTLLMTGALLREGGVAAKGESSGIAHGRKRWAELAADYAKATKNADAHAQGATLYWAWVRRPVLDERETVLYSCGMHLLGERDIEIESALDLAPALEWIDLLGLYLAADRPRRAVKDGDGFRLNDSGPRRVLRLRPCERYPEDDFFFNPYGLIRLEASEPKSGSH
jgi:hypothetical protein